MQLSIMIFSNTFSKFRIETNRTRKTDGLDYYHKQLITIFILGRENIRKPTMTYGGVALVKEISFLSSNRIFVDFIISIRKLTRDYNTKNFNKCAVDFFATTFSEKIF